MTTTKLLIDSTMLLAPPAVPGCSTAPTSESARTVQSADVNAFLMRVKEEDPSIWKFFENCEAFAAFPDIGKGGAAVSIINPVGLMLEASVGGQPFSFRAASDVE